jgi:hypothetical protein
VNKAKSKSANFKSSSYTKRDYLDVKVSNDLAFVLFLGLPLSTGAFITPGFFWYQRSRAAILSGLLPLLHSIVP